jgi:hypothetical protein
VDDKRGTERPSIIGDFGCLLRIIATITMMAFVLITANWIARAIVTRDNAIHDLQRRVGQLEQRQQR